MKSVDQLIQYNIGNIFVEKSYTKCADEIIPRPLSKLEHICGSIV